MARAEFRTRTDFGSVNYQIHQTTVNMTPSANGSDEDEFDCGAFIDRANQRNHLPHTGSSTTTQSWAEGS